MTHSTEKNPMGIHHCFAHFGYRNGLRISGGEARRDYQHESSKTICRESVSVSMISAIEKLGMKEGAGITILRRIFFVSQYRNISKRIFSVFH